MKRNAQTLAVLAADLRGLVATHAPTADPTTSALVARFAGDANAVSRAIEQGHRAFARDTVAGVASYCIGCHTRSPRAAAIRPVLRHLDPRLSPFDRAELLAATHRFSEAQALYDAVLDDERFALDHQADYERAVAHGLAIDVRALGDVDHALATVERVLLTPGAEPLWDDAVEWRAALHAWKREGASAPCTNADLRKLLSTLMREAQASARVPADRGADIQYLRATAIAHELLARTPHDAQVLAWLGVAYEALADLDVWSLDMLYDEACVREAPHTSLAQGCFERFERRALLEYSGNGGAPLPDDVEATRRALRRLATPASTGRSL
jgi:hypothetical protein